MSLFSPRTERSPAKALRHTRGPAAAAFLLSLLLCVPAAAAADLTDLSLEQLMDIPVYSASRHDQSSSEAPSSVTVITKNEIRKYGWRTLAELLRSVRGMFVTYDRVYSYVGARGFALPGDLNTKLLILLDGHRVNDDVYNQGYVGEDFLLDLDLVDRVEVVRGPTSSLYGSNAFLGVVSVFTRRGADLAGAEVSAEAGSYDAYRGRATYGNAFGNGVDLILSGSFYQRHGGDLYYREFDTPETNGGRARNLDGERVPRFFGSLTFQGVTLETAYVSRAKDVPTSYYGGVFPDSTNESNDKMFFAEARLDRTFWETSVFARLFYDQYRFYGQSTYEDSELVPDPPYRFLLKDTAQDKALGAEVKLSRTFAERYGLTIGGEYRDVYELKQHTYSDAPVQEVLDTNRPFQSWALFAQTEARLGPGVLLNAGVRYDHYSTFGGTTNPRVALIWSPLGETCFKFLYGQAFRAPNAYELYWNDGGLTAKGNPDLEPEKIRTYEVVWEQTLGSHLRSTLSGYFYRLENLITSVTDPSDDLSVFRNSGTMVGKGIEAELAGRWQNGIDGRISYAYQRGRDDSGSDLPNFPRHVAKGNLGVPLFTPNLFLAVEVQYLSRRTPAESHQTDAKAYTVVNASLYSRELLKGLEASAGICNLFGESYSDLGGTEHEQELLRQDGRTFRAKLTYKF